MLPNARAEVEASATKTTDAQPVSYTTVTETRQLLTQALTQVEADRQSALDAIAAANNTLGEPEWPDHHPAGRVLALALEAQHETIATNTDKARRHLREALQLLEAVEAEVTAE